MSDNRYGALCVSLGELVFHHDKMVDMLHAANWPPNGVGIALIEFFVISQHRRAGITLEQCLAQWKTIWSLCDQVESGTPDDKLKVM